MGACASALKDAVGQAPEEPTAETVASVEVGGEAVEPVAALEVEATEPAETVEKDTEKEETVLIDESKSQPTESESTKPEEAESDKNNDDSLKEEAEKKDPSQSPNA